MNVGIHSQIYRLIDHACAAHAVGTSPSKFQTRVVRLRLLSIPTLWSCGRCSESLHLGRIQRRISSRKTVVSINWQLNVQCQPREVALLVGCPIPHPLSLSFQTIRNQTRHDAGYVHDPSEFLIVTALAIMWWFGKSTKVTPRTVACLTCDVIGRACVRTSAINGKALNGP